MASLYQSVEELDRKRDALKREKAKQPARPYTPTPKGKSDQQKFAEKLDEFRAKRASATKPQARSSIAEKVAASPAAKLAKASQLKEGGKQQLASGQARIAQREQSALDALRKNRERARSGSSTGTAVAAEPKKAPAPESSRAAREIPATSSKTKEQFTPRDQLKKAVSSRAEPGSASGAGEAAGSKEGGGFGAAFASARKAGKGEFTFNGKKYNARLKGEVDVKKPEPGAEAARKPEQIKKGEGIGARITRQYAASQPEGAGPAKLFPPKQGKRTPESLAKARAEAGKLRTAPPPKRVNAGRTAGKDRWGRRKFD